ncbi:MAG TPA: phosphosulfolactate synthase [Ktedonobacterales bacterium]|nr:phosphosulfolactate synthase [Ktedonobacterales bacterium]
MKAWADAFPHLDERSRKPRTAGVTMMIDKGLGPHATADLLDLAGDFVDHWKLSFGTSALMNEPLLRDKVAIVRERATLVYPGGTLTEYAILQGACQEYLKRAKGLGFNGVEISDGTIDLPAEARRDAMLCALDLGLTVVAEVGKKDPRRQPTAKALAAQALIDLEIGASWVIVEARESGQGVGVYGADGSVLAHDVDTLVAGLDGRLDRLIWEAPLKSQQEYFILRFGPDTSLGNIQPGDLLALEALRAGLRFETLRPIVEKMEREEPLSLSERIARLVVQKLPEA